MVAGRGEDFEKGGKGRTVELEAARTCSSLVICSVSRTWRGFHPGWEEAASAN